MFPELVRCKCVLFLSAVQFSHCNVSPLLTAVNAVFVGTRGTRLPALDLAPDCLTITAPGLCEFVPRPRAEIGIYLDGLQAL